MNMTWTIFVNFRLKQNLNNLCQLWQESRIKSRKNMLLATIQAVKKWNKKTVSFHLDILLKYIVKQFCFPI